MEERDGIASIDIARATGETRLRYWFPVAYRESLEAIFYHILSFHEDVVRTFFLCGFSNILRRCSIWLSGSTKAQKDLSRTLGDPVEEFRRQVLSMIQRNRLYWDDLIARGISPGELHERCTIRLQDARQLDLPDNTFDLLVTSPPYAICYEYKEIHQLTQLWFERYSLLCPDPHRDAWIGSQSAIHRDPDAISQQSGSDAADAALTELEARATGTVAGDVRSEVRALRYYFQDMRTALGELARVMVPGKYLALIVGDSYRRGVTIPTSAALSEMAGRAGFALERKIVRQVPVRVLVSTRDKKTGRFSSSAQSDTQVYPEEHVLIFRCIA